MYSSTIQLVYECTSVKFGRGLIWGEESLKGTTTTRCVYVQDILTRKEMSEDMASACEDLSTSQKQSDASDVYKLQAQDIL